MFLYSNKRRLCDAWVAPLDALQCYLDNPKKINKQCNKNELTIDDIARIIKLDSFVKESLRFFNPVVGLLHKYISKSYYIFANGYQVPSGHDTNNNEELKGQNFTEFHAHHHLEHNSPITKLKYNILTFRGRKRVCLGRALAINEIKVFLHKILLKYDVRTDHEEIGSKRRYFCPLIALINGGLLFEKRKEIVN
ncbi:cytochrome P450 [Gigaspora margarita]|uniref:Cytochrome P450 n=1 Tax=Gigaspora margarita TaxID=4874 RepID=A0A8H4B599_GIGMA|nr:cytochrome P450 [Gigaspora margarita]